MNSFLIKLGKARRAVKNEGIIRGGKKAVSGFLKMFRRVGSGDVLFVTQGVGDSALYRVHHVAEELEIHNFKCSITIQDNPFLPKYADKFKIFIFHRAIYSQKVAKLIEAVKKQEKEIIFETDDLIFDPEYLHWMEYYRNASQVEKKVLEKGIGREILTDFYVKACTTTTSYLAGILKTYSKKVFIVPNKLSNKDLETADKIMKHKTYNMKQNGNEEKNKCFMLHASCCVVKIGYFSGTKSHDKDFATITEPLLKIMEKYPNVELFLAGPLEISDEFVKFKNRIKRLPYVSRQKHFKNIAGIDINLAPLEIGNPFCEAKSELKFFEAGILGVPTVAAATRMFQEAIDDGIDGFLAVTEDEWRDKIEKLVIDNNLRIEMSRKAREKVLRDYTDKNSHNEEYYNYLRSKL